MLLGCVTTSLAGPSLCRGLEDDGSRVKSHSNQWEVDMATALVQHLFRQGEYTSADIALLTPYTGQLRKLRTSLSNDFEICLSDRDLETLAADRFEKAEDEKPESSGYNATEKKTLLQTLRLATVDNFQGEEAKVIVVSLVRSDQKRKVGFLHTENRINMLLSHAQHGMYLIGNTETFLNVPMWADVHSQLSRVDAVGAELALCCPRHPDTPILCSELATLNGRALKVGAVCRVPVDLSHVVINARPSAIRWSCTTALHVESPAPVSDRPVSMNAPRFVVKIVAIA
ncbi:uncharacterized protein N7506_000107 [Penicillium brevicompactum]|uniref:uncharacterized protein n=1 Tax=Penicillium brevicompactum TaxID=5074 RepID=UPI00254137FE|nr:uncharacterized protein N7506_000107 [Penicillium brevicompactum]KAJ5346854.1 hypothetical protein N7506_000107 [Penicillium brevicompactum]